MMSLPIPVLVYLIIGLALLAAVLIMAPQAVRWPRASRVQEVCFTLGFVVAFVVAWPRPAWIFGTLFWRAFRSALHERHQAEGRKSP